MHIDNKIPKSVDIINYPVASESESTSKDDEWDNDTNSSSVAVYMNHMPNAEDFEVKCKHLKTALQCHEVSTEDVKRVREFVYRQPVKTIIDNKIAHLIEVKHPKRKKSEETLTNKGQAIRLDYFLRNINSEWLLLCQKTFLAALKISQRNILTIEKRRQKGR
ncbi:unnamed protein product [Acanthoscelides obtectus]|uniref:Uncharacterized protein n=1 Tax=Acanthoscelides obtectus TaxID=200917 RepID=A0A9P0P5L0_ACAOB|nr:unnamed protein product [Acanthoscelides obtectus]CAK1651745.1 hypothetical protein AOBTE_LOCUS17430 [Acanthoscelides obtectus]